MQWLELDLRLELFLVPIIQVGRLSPGELVKSMIQDLLLHYRALMAMVIHIYIFVIFVF